MVNITSWMRLQFELRFTLINSSASGSEYCYQ